MVQEKGRTRVNRALHIEWQKQQLYEYVTILPEEAGGREGGRSLHRKSRTTARRVGLAPGDFSRPLRPAPPPLRKPEMHPHSFALPTKKWHLLPNIVLSLLGIPQGHPGVRPEDLVTKDEIHNCASGVEDEERHLG